MGKLILLHNENKVEMATIRSKPRNKTDGCQFKHSVRCEISAQNNPQRCGRTIRQLWYHGRGSHGVKYEWKNHRCVEKIVVDNEFQTDYIIVTYFCFK